MEDTVGKNPQQWLTSTFSSRQKTIDLLSPEVQNGILSVHDFELATRFLPGWHRHYPIIYSSAAAIATCMYGYYRGSPRWTPRRFAVMTTTATILGMVYGQIREVFQHKKFVDALEDPSGYMKALNNVHMRLGGTTPLAFSLERIRNERTSRGREQTRPDEFQGPEMTRDDSWEQTNANVVENPGPPSQPSPSSSTWDAIRAQNSRNSGKPSSWDVLRQNHERARAPSASPTIDDYDSRASEQARFDAMLEAERRASAQDSDFQTRT